MGNIKTWERELNEVARSNNCELSRTGSGHYRLSMAGEPKCVIASATPKDPHRAMMNIRQDVRRVFSGQAN